jgi:hypothetical protein
MYIWTYSVDVVGAHGCKINAVTKPRRRWKDVFRHIFLVKVLASG